jgi:hypothetical protein
VSEVIGEVTIVGTDVKGVCRHDGDLHLRRDYYIDVEPSPLEGISSQTVTTSLLRGLSDVLSR